MSLAELRISLRTGEGWERVFTTDHAGERPAPTADAGGEVLDDLRASWETPGTFWPAQPSPVTLSFALYIPDLTDATWAHPRPQVGRAVALWIADTAWDPTDPALANLLPLFEFYGRMSDVEATPYGDHGMRFDITAVDYLAELNEESGGDYLLDTAADWGERYEAIRAAHPDLPLEFAYAEGYTPILWHRDPAPLPVGELLELVFGDASEWFNATNYILDPTDPRRFPTSFWQRPFMCYRYLGPGSSLPAALADWLEPGATYQAFTVAKFLSTAYGNGFRYRLTADPTTGALTRSLVTGETAAAKQQFAILPASAVERSSVRWRQDKRSRPNKVRLTGTFDTNDSPGGPTRAAAVRRLWQSVRERGPVEVARESLIYYRDQALATALVYLGDELRTRPAWSLDEVTLRPQLIGDPTDWPRLFPGLFGDVYPAAGKLTLVTGINDLWNRYDRPDYSGRLTGASLELRGGVVRLTARILNDIPVADGLPEERLTALSLPALGDPTPAMFGAITAADLRLTGA